MVLKTFAHYRKEGYSIWVQRSSHGQHNYIPEHEHDYIELVYVVHGEGRHTINNEVYQIGAGDVYFILPGERHSYPDMKSADLEIINCLFLPEFVRQLLPEYPDGLLSLPYVAPFYESLPLLPRKLPLGSQQSTAVLSILENMIYEVKNRAPGFNMVTGQRLMELLVLFSRYALQPDPPLRAPGISPGNHELLVRRICLYLETNFQQKITADGLTQQFNISPRHLHRVFKQETGTSITAKLHHIRIERAKHLLGESDRSIESIAAAVGFSDPSFFTRLFSRLTGMTPGGFRKLRRSRRIS
ncbi:AraC family transcriptional regulator [Paenibacillus sp. y28]|uniref:AraC family transcriptional regulator n=1 Tax=Paenibacillus sp. y28 TaxID=3129110 RepID=UPI003016546F